MRSRTSLSGTPWATACYERRGQPINVSGFESGAGGSGRRRDSPDAQKVPQAASQRVGIRSRMCASTARSLSVLSRLSEQRGRASSRVNCSYKSGARSSSGWRDLRCCCGFGFGLLTLASNLGPAVGKTLTPPIAIAVGVDVVVQGCFDAVRRRRRCYGYGVGLVLAPNGIHHHSNKSAQPHPPSTPGPGAGGHRFPAPAAPLRPDGAETDRRSIRISLGSKKFTPTE